MRARDELIDFLVNYGGRCRDCADEDGFCPQTGIGCGQRRKAVEFILGAIDYGTKHGFAAGYRLIGPDDAKLIQTALEHASFTLDGIVALDDEDMGKDGASATAQHTKRTVDRALKALLSIRGATK